MALDLYQYFNVALIIYSVTIFQLSKKKRNKELSFWTNTAKIHCFLIILIVNGELDFDLQERVWTLKSSKVQKRGGLEHASCGNHHYLLTEAFYLK